MTEPIRPELRAQGSGVEGHSYDTDDLIGDFDIYEALVNPHDESGAGAKRGGAGGPGMMPMGQGAGAAGAGSAGVAGRPLTAAGAKGTSAAGAGGAAGMGAGGFGSAGSADAGLGAGGGASGLGGLGGVGGLGGRMPTGGGASWSPSTFGTSAAGLDPIDPSTIPSYGTPTIPGGGVPSVPTPGSSTVPTIPSAPGGSSHPSPGGASPTVPTLKAPTMPGGGAGGGLPGAGGAGGPGSASTDAMGNQAVQASPEMLRKEAQAWDQVAQDMGSGVTDQITPLAPSAVDFGMVKDAYPSYNDVLSRVKAWAASAGAEFSAISEALNAAAVGYAETDASNTSAAKTIAI